MDIADIKLAGHILRNKDGLLMTRKKLWKDADETGGWIWSNTEIRQIIRESVDWDFPPTHKQVAFLSRRTGLTVITGPLEKI